MATHFMTPDLPVLYDPESRAGKGILQFHHTCLQPGCSRYDLKRRTRLISIIDRRITPHLIQQLLLRSHFPTLVFDLPIESKWIIQIKFRYIDHGKQFSILWIHNDHRYLLCPFFLLDLQSHLLGVHLDIVIQTDRQIMTGNWFLPILKGIFKFDSCRIRHGQDLTISAFQPILIFHLQTDDPLIVTSRKAKYLRCQGIIRIIPFIIFIHFYTCQMLLPDLISCLLIHIGPDNLARTVFFYFFSYLFLRHGQKL